MGKLNYMDSFGSCILDSGGGEVAQSCLTLCDPVDCSLPGSSVHGICQARVLEWGATAFSNKKSIWACKQTKIELKRNKL